MHACVKRASGTLPKSTRNVLVCNVAATVVCYSRTNRAYARGGMYVLCGKRHICAVKKKLT